MITTLMVGIPMMIISLEYKLEKNYPSGSFEDYMQRFKAQAHKFRIEALRYKTAMAAVTKLQSL